MHTKRIAVDADHGLTCLAMCALTLTLALAGCGNDRGNAGGEGVGAGVGAGGGQAGANGGAAGRVGAADGDEAEPRDNSGDDFEAVGVNPFVMTAHDPRSTFAADVDTASYDIFRRDVLAGVKPRPESVRLEEFVNYFSYDYDAPAHDADEPFVVRLGAAPSLSSTNRTILGVGIQGKDAPPAEERRAANVVFLVDVSGSMNSGSKLGLVKTVLKETLTVLEPDDRVAIVTYAGNTSVRLESTPVSQSAEIVGVLDSLDAGGSTRGAEGIQLAYLQAEGNFIEGGVNHVILCTDGDFNVGVSDTAGLLDLIREKRRSGVTFTALGFGMGNLNDSMLEAVSNAGNGMYGVITDEDQAIDYVHDRMLGNLTLIAKDMKIQVWFNPEHVVAYRLLGYENRDIADHDFRNDAVDAGEVGAGHTVTALYELVLRGDGDDAGPPTPDGAPAVDDGEAFDGELQMDLAELVRVMIRHKDVDATEQDAAHEIQHALLPADVAAVVEDLRPDFRFAAAVADLAELLKGSPFVSVQALGSVRATVAELAGADPDRLELVDLIDRLAVIIGE